MKILDDEDQRDLCIRIHNRQQNIRNGFLKPWKIASMVGQMNDFAKYKIPADTMGFFRNCMEMEGFTEDGVREIHDLVMNSFKDD